MNLSKFTARECYFDSSIFAHKMNYISIFHALLPQVYQLELSLFSEKALAQSHNSFS